MTTIRLNDLTEDPTVAQPVTLEEASQVMGGGKPKPKSAPKQDYIKYELEDVLVSSWQ